MAGAGSASLQSLAPGVSGALLTTGWPRRRHSIGLRLQLSPANTKIAVVELKTPMLPS